MSRARSVLTAVLAFGLSAPATVTADITSGLAGYWPLDGDARDVSGNELHGTIYGNVTPTLDRFEYEASAMNFPGQATSYIDLGTPPELLIKGAMTVAAWVRAETLNQTGRVLAKQGPASARSWGINLETAGYARFDVGINPTDRVRVDSDVLSFGADEWFHMAGVFRPGESVELYLNGEMVNSEATTMTTQWIENDLPINIGRRPQPGTPWNGDVDEARIYGRALSPEDIQELYQFMPSPRYQAWSPKPADGAGDVVVPLLEWKSGVTALLHEVYFGNDPNLGADDLVQPRSPATIYFHMTGLTPGTTYYWRVDEIEADMGTIHTGEVWSFTARPYTAYQPSPADGATDAPPDPNLTLSWQAGRDAIEHHLYFGSSFADVNDGAAVADKGTLTDTRFVLPDSLQPLNTYYWRVDEIALDGAVQTGAVWSFATFSVVDDFESYTNEVGQRVFEVWVDGIGFTQPEPGNPGNGTGAAVGHDIWSPDSPHFEATIVETEVVLAGAQSMPLYYDNTAQPFYSEAERAWSTPQNWTADGVETLVVYIRGRVENDPAPFYVGLADSSDGAAFVTHPDPDAAITARWIEWRISLGQLADQGVDLSRVKTMRIGLGDRSATTAGSAGQIYVDEVRLTKPVLSGEASQ